MSKFFNQTLRLRSAVLPADGFTLTELPDSNESDTVDSTTEQRSGDVRLEQCRKMVVPIDKLLQDQFEGSHGLESAEESYRALRTRLLRLRADREMRSIVITSSIQGEGKTHTSVNLAQFCAQLHDMRVLLIDGDIRSSGMTRRLNLPPTPGLGEVLAGNCETEQAIIATDNPNLYLLSAGTSTVAPAELFAGQRWQELIKWCNESFQLVLIDSAPVLNLADVELMTAACDGVLMVVRALHTKRELLQKSAAQIDSKKLVGLVYNAMDGNSFHRYPYRSYGASPKS
jgi:capsular exopolysaccharide synthesis family protein